jgi:hypothetical protein
MKRLLIAALSLFATTACVVGGRAIGPAMPGPAPEARPAGPINSGEAERIALRIAAQRGYTQPQVKKVHHDEGHGGRWKVEIRGLANGRDGKIDVRLADDGKVLEVKDHQKGDKGHDHDDDDNGHGKKDKDKKDKHDDDD